VSVHSVDPVPVQRPVGLLHLAGRPLGAAAEACREFLAARGDTMIATSGTENR
jgi:hypothetical protein